MDNSALIDEIVARVAAKLGTSDVEKLPELIGKICREKQPGLLILTQEHGTFCHTCLESQRLLEYFFTSCAKMQDYQVDLDSIDVVILFDLTIDAMVKLASGVQDTPFLKLASQAILSGKRIYVPQEEVELYHFAKSAPPAYYAMLKEKLDLLTSSGVVVCPEIGLEDKIIMDHISASPCQCGGKEEAPVSAEPAPAPREEKEITLTKRVITERDITEASTNKVTCIHLGSKCILTDLARDAAKARDIRIIKE